MPETAPAAPPTPEPELWSGSTCRMCGMSIAWTGAHWSHILQPGQPGQTEQAQQADRLPGALRITGMTQSSQTGETDQPNQPGGRRKDSKIDPAHRLGRRLNQGAACSSWPARR